MTEAEATQRIGEVSSAVSRTGESVGEVLAASQSMLGQATSLRGTVETFLGEVKAA